MPNQDLLELRAEVDLSEKVFTNLPNMPVLCFTVIGLIKIYTRFEKIATLADNFLVSRLYMRWLLCFHSLRLPGAAKPAKTKTAEARENRRFAFFWLRYVAPAR